ncbi:MAG: hypothetical protein CVV34_02420 [Methanomicrobiales archaeon HGW-Methanomicrobiales-5]|nr:MAG: hypothetical protein CVV34_02420 [Methanomicrobiales archaeon HGW-Methanomicrobiales-5]
MSSIAKKNEATSPVIGGILTIAITMVLAVLILLLCHIPNFALPDTEAPAIFKITNIRHTNENGILNYDSYMVVINSGEITYNTQNLYAKTYRNGILLDSVITTMNGHDFISSHHFGIQYIVGMTGQKWNSQQRIGIDFKDRTFHPDDVVIFEVYDITTDQIISRDTYPHKTEHDAQWFYHYFINHQAV